MMALNVVSLAWVGVRTGRDQNRRQRAATTALRMSVVLWNVSQGSGVRCEVRKWVHRSKKCQKKGYESQRLWSKSKISNYLWNLVVSEPVRIASLRRLENWVSLWLGSVDLCGGYFWAAEVRERETRVTWGFKGPLQLGKSFGTEPVWTELRAEFLSQEMNEVKLQA